MDDRPRHWPTVAAMHKWHREHGMRVLEWQEVWFKEEQSYRPTLTELVGRAE